MLIHEKNSRVRPYELEHVHPPHSPQMLLTIQADRATGFSERSRSIFVCCWFLLVYAGCNVGMTASCDEDVGDVGVAELDEPVEKPGSAIGT